MAFADQANTTVKVYLSLRKLSSINCHIGDQILYSSPVLFFVSEGIHWQYQISVTSCLFVKEKRKTQYKKKRCFSNHYKLYLFKSRVNSYLAYLSSSSVFPPPMSIQQQHLITLDLEWLFGLLLGENFVEKA